MAARADEPLADPGRVDGDADGGDEQRVDGPVPGRRVGARQVGVGPEPAAGAVHLVEHGLGQRRAWVSSAASRVAT